jgi:hypothetical protein
MIPALNDATFLMLISFSATGHFELSFAAAAWKILGAGEVTQSC